MDNLLISRRFFFEILYIINSEDYQNESSYNEAEKSERSKIAKKSIEEAFSALNERQSTILKMRMGLKPYEKRYTLKEVGESFGVTPEPIRTQHSLALTKISAYIAERMREAGYPSPFESLLGNSEVDNLLVLIENTQPGL